MRKHMRLTVFSEVLFAELRHDEAEKSTNVTLINFLICLLYSFMC